MTLESCQLNVAEAYTVITTNRGLGIDRFALNNVTAKPKGLLIIIL